MLAQLDGGGFVGLLMGLRLMRWVGDIGLEFSEVIESGVTKTRRSQEQQHPKLNRDSSPCASVLGSLRVCSQGK